MADDELRARALAAVEAELDRLRGLGRAGVEALAHGSPHDAPSDDGVTLTTRVEPEDDRLMVLVEAWRGRRTFATGGFAMGPDGQTHTPD
jgi:hypothetical protein